MEEATTAAAAVVDVIGTAAHVVAAAAVVVAEADQILGAVIIRNVAMTSLLPNVYAAFLVPPTNCHRLRSRKRRSSLVAIVYMLAI